MKNIEEHIERDLTDLYDALANGNKQRARHISDELEQLENYKKNHPGEEHDPSPLELYCEFNPESDECRIYEN